MNVKLYTPNGSEVSVPERRAKEFLGMGYTRSKPKPKTAGGRGSQGKAEDKDADGK